MRQFINSIKNSFKKNIFIGIADVLFRLFSAFIWVVVVVLLWQFVWEAFTVPQLASQKMWWLSYSVLVFIVISTLAYTAIFDRE